jgi:putative transcriptional regulator
MLTITNNIRRLRFEHNEMTQEELANRTGCTRQTIIALEQGKYVPSLELAFKIAAAFKVKVEDVFHYKEQPSVIKYDKIKNGEQA